MPKSSDAPDGGARYPVYTPSCTNSLPKMTSNSSRLPDDMKTMSLKQLSMPVPKSNNKNKGPSPLANKKLNSQSMPQGLDATGNSSGSVTSASSCISQSEEDLSREPLSDDSEDEMVL